MDRFINKRSHLIKLHLFRLELELLEEQVQVKQ